MFISNYIHKNAHSENIDKFISIKMIIQKSTDNMQNTKNDVFLYSNTELLNILNIFKTPNYSTCLKHPRRIQKYSKCATCPTLSECAHCSQCLQFAWCSTCSTCENAKHAQIAQRTPKRATCCKCTTFFLQIKLLHMLIHAFNDL